LLASADAITWLREFRTIFIGGGPIWPELTEEAAAMELPIALSYGMTETAAMVAAIKPEEFLKGERTGEAALPHAVLSIAEGGTICIEGASVFRGYFPELRKTQRFETNDEGQIDERGRLHVFGRKDAVIITGGKKVHPSEVEAALQATGQFSDVAVVGVADAEWGERVVACFPNDETTTPDLAVVEQSLENSLASYKRPKRYVAITPWPRNVQGKLNRVELARRVATG
jgi:O-succinylbenzoic acid--CoA ligase